MGSQMPKFRAIGPGKLEILVIEYRHIRCGFNFRMTSSHYHATKVLVIRLRPIDNIRGKQSHTIPVLSTSCGFAKNSLIILGEKENKFGEVLGKSRLGKLILRG